jgi:hypothetical protein
MLIFDLQSLILGMCGVTSIAAGIGMLASLL